MKDWNMIQALTNTCHLGFDCKNMTGFGSLDCPNLQICADSARQHTPTDYYTPRESLPYYIDTKNNALTVYPFLSPAAREVGWHVALRLPYKYENNCLIVDSNLYFYENSQSVQIELALSGWLPPQQLFWQIIDGYLEVVQSPREFLGNYLSEFLEVLQDLPQPQWDKPSLLPYSKVEDGLYVGDVYYLECLEVGWQKASDLIAIYGLVYYVNYCPDCACYQVASVPVGDREFNYTSYYHCPNCLWSAKIMTQWIEQNYFIEPEPATTAETPFDRNDA